MPVRPATGEPATLLDAEMDVVIEAFTEHPELESVYLEDTLAHQADDPLYVEADR